MSKNNITFIIIIIITSLAFFILSSIIQYKRVKKNSEEHSSFLEGLKIGEKIVLSSGVLGVILHKNKYSYSIEIAKDVIIEVLPSSIIGRRK